MMRRILGANVILCVTAVLVNSYQSGAPVGQCTNMQPSINSHGAEQTTESPYTLHLSHNNPWPGDSLTVSLSSTTESKFRGILLEARTITDGAIVGSFSTNLAFKTLDCTGPGSKSAVTHNSNADKDVHQLFTLTIPANLTEDFEFVATIVKTKTTYWRNIKSETVNIEMPCPDVETRGETLKQCYDSLEGPSATFNDICSYLESTTNCLATAMDQCEHIYNALSSTRQNFHQLLAVFGCRANVSGHIFEPSNSACSLRKYSMCTSNMSEAVGLGQITPETDLVDFLTQLSTITDDTISNNRQQICSAINQHEAGAATKCMVDESLKCTSFLKSGQILPSPLPYPLEGVYITLNNSIIQTVFQLIEEAKHRVDYTESFCDDGCADYNARILQFGGCLFTAGLGTDPDAVSNYLNQLITTYNAGASYSQECSILEKVKTCTNEHLQGCDMTEQLVAGYLNSASAYQAVDLCQEQLDFTPKHLVGGCSNPEFVHEEMRKLHKTCGSLTLSSADLQGKTKGEICELARQMAYCVSTESLCCDLRKSTLEPMQHPWGLMNQMMGCDIKMDGSGLLVKPKANCDYSEVLACFNPLLEKVGLNAMTLNQLEVSDMQKIVSLREYFVGHADQCLDQNAFDEIKNCAIAKVTNCPYPSTCDSRQNTMATSEAIPLADFLAFDDIMDMCSQACRNSDPSDEVMEECEMNEFHQHVIDVAWSVVTGGDTSQRCQDLKVITDCLQQKVGDCPILARMVQMSLPLDIEATKEAISACGVSFEYLEALIQSTGTPDENTTKSGITGAESARPILLLLIVAVISLLAVV